MAYVVFRSTRLASLPTPTTLQAYLARYYFLTCEPPLTCAELAHGVRAFFAGVSVPQLAGELYAARAEIDHGHRCRCTAGNHCCPSRCSTPLRLVLAYLKDRRHLRAVRRYMDDRRAVPAAAVPRAEPLDPLHPGRRLLPDDAALPHPGDARGTPSGVRADLPKGQTK